MKQKDMAREWLVNGQVWQVKFKRNIEDTEKTVVFGLSDPSERINYIKLGQGFEERLDTFFHEFLHSIEYEYGIEMDHDLVKKLAPAMAKFYIENF